MSYRCKIFIVNKLTRTPRTIKAIIFHFIIPLSSQIKICSKMLYTIMDCFITFSLIILIYNLAFYACCYFSHIYWSSANFLQKMYTILFTSQMLIFQHINNVFHIIHNSKLFFPQHYPYNTPQYIEKPQVINMLSTVCA